MEKKYNMELITTAHEGRILDKSDLENIIDENQMQLEDASSWITDSCDMKNDETSLELSTVPNNIQIPLQSNVSNIDITERNSNIFFIIYIIYRKNKYFNTYLTFYHSIIQENLENQKILRY